jgi:hypothetical protein
MYIVKQADVLMKAILAVFASAAILSAATLNVSFADPSDDPMSDQIEEHHAPASDAAPVPGPAPVPGSAPAVQSERAAPPDNQIANDVDAHIARLKADLRLTADQENNWTGLQTSLRDFEINQMAARTAGRSTREDRRDRSDRERSDRPNDIAMMRSEADRLSAHSAALKKLADAAEPLYGSLDDRQKRRLVQFLRNDLEMYRR